MKKLYLFTFIILSFFNVFSQMKIDENTPITSGDPIFLKYHKVSITPPKGYYFLESYSSFVSVETNTTISVAKKKGVSYKTMVNNFLNTNSKLANSKMISHESIDGGTLFVFQFEVQGVLTQRMMYLKGDEKNVYYAMANYKLKDKSKYFSLLKKTVTSIKL